MTEAYEIGKRYNVPCVLTTNKMIPKNRWGCEWVPIMGPQHADAEIINFPWQHWHVDWRFVSKRLWKRLTEQYGMATGRFIGDSGVFALPLQRYQTPTSWRGSKEDLEKQFVATGKVVTRGKMCLREFPEWPRSYAGWLPRLEDHCQHLRMTNMVCPHRGIPLKGCPTNGDVVTCPGHGLSWNIHTGELVRYIKVEATTLRAPESMTMKQNPHDALATEAKA